MHIDEALQCKMIFQNNYKCGNTRKKEKYKQIYVK